MAENGRFWQIYRRFGWFRGAGDRCQPIVSLFSMTFLETDGLEVGRKASDSRVFWHTLAVVLPLRRTCWGRFGALDGCLLVGLPGRLMAGHVATNGDTARRNARATSDGPNSRRRHGTLRACSTSLVACFMFEGGPRLPWFYLDSQQTVQAWNGRVGPVIFPYRFSTLSLANGGRVSGSFGCADRV